MEHPGVQARKAAPWGWLANRAGRTSSAKALQAKEKAAATAKKDQAAQEAQVKEVAASPWTQLGNSLAQQYQQAETPAASLISGAQTVPGQNTADQTALALLFEPVDGFGAGDRASDAQFVCKIRSEVFEFAFAGVAER